IARGCRQIRGLTIITNATNIAAELEGSSAEVILTGGTLRKNSFSLVGPLAEESLRKLSADMLFLAVDGFDVSYGLTTPNQLEARVNRAMSEAARRTIVVCDSSKFGRRSLSLIMPVSSVHETINDRGAYVFTGLRPATYTFRVEANNFSAVERKGLVLAVNQRATLDISVTPGSVSASITVTTQAPLLDTADASLGTDVTNEYVRD